MKLSAATFIRGDIDRLRGLTLEPEPHARWDLRFTDIAFAPDGETGGPQRFCYATRIGLGKRIEGWGETSQRRDGRGSTLRFGSDDPKSLIRRGGGYWLYEPHDGGVRFSTEYDYQVRFGLPGRLVDRAVFRPLMNWATRWSFDRLRLWMERGIQPEHALTLWGLKVLTRVSLGLVWLLEGLVPKLLWVSPGELALVRDSGLYWPTPAATLAVLGAFEIAGGAWLMLGWKERWSAVIAAAAMCVLSGIAVLTEPAVLIEPMGGIRKGIALLACSVVIWFLSPLSPRADRATPGVSSHEARGS